MKPILKKTFGSSLPAWAKILISTWAAAKNNNPHSNGQMSSPPTVVVTNGSNPAAVPTEFRWLTNQDKFKADGGRLKIYATNYRRFPVATLNNSGTGGNTGDAEDATVWRMTVDVTSRYFCARVLDVAGTRLRIIVDGEYVSVAGTAAPGVGGSLNLLIDLTTTATRRISVEYEQAGAFLGCSVDSGGTIALPSDSGQRLIILGDSFTQGTNDTGGSYLRGYARSLGDLLGVNEMWASGLGGTGYLNDVSGTRYTIRERSALDATDQSPDIIVIFAGFNDFGSSSAAAIGAECAATITAIRAESATVPIIVGGIWPQGETTPSSTILDAEAAIKTAVISANDVNTVFVPVSSAPTPWNYEVGTDGTHPSPAGHDALAAFAAEGIIAALRGGFSTSAGFFIINTSGDKLDLDTGGTDHLLWSS